MTVTELLDTVKGEDRQTDRQAGRQSFIHVNTTVNDIHIIYLLFILYMNISYNNPYIILYIIQ